MFASLLNKGFRGSLVLLIVLLLTAALCSLLSVKSLENGTYPDLFYNYFKDKIHAPALVTLLNYSLIGLGMFLVSMVSVNQEISDKQNYFPVFIYFFISSTCVNPLELTPQLFTNLLLLYAFYKLLDTYRQEYVLKQIFDAGIWISFTLYFTISSVLFIPVFFIALSILRSFHWREWAMAILGVMVPVFFYECMAYLSNFNRWYVFGAAADYFRSFKVPVFSEYYLAFSTLLILLLLLSILQPLLRGFGNTVKKQRSKWILLWLLFFLIPAFFAGGHTNAGIILTYALPLSFLIGDFLFQIKQIKITNTLLSILMLSAVIVFLGKLGFI